jgi:hypothetical protein
MKPSKLLAFSAVEMNSIKALEAAEPYASRLHLFTTVASILAEGESREFFIAIDELGRRFFGGQGKDFEKTLIDAGLDRAAITAINELHQTESCAEIFAALALGFEWGQLMARGTRR